MATTKKTAEEAPISASEAFGEDGTEDLSKFDRSDLAPKVKSAFTRDQLAELAESDDPLALLAQYAAAQGKEIAEVSEALGDGTTVVQKPMLVNKEFYVIDWRFCESGKFASTFAAVKCMDMSKRPGENGRLFVFTDGGSGIHDRLVDYHMKHGSSGIIHCPYGLSPSTYETEDGSGNPISATTWYFANGPVKP